MSNFYCLSDTDMPEKCGNVFFLAGGVVLLRHLSKEYGASFLHRTGSHKQFFRPRSCPQFSRIRLSARTSFPHVVARAHIFFFCEIKEWLFCCARCLFRICATRWVQQTHVVCMRLSTPGTKKGERTIRRDKGIVSFIVPSIFFLFM